LKILIAGVSCHKYSDSEQAGDLGGRMTAATDAAGDHWFARDESCEIILMRSTNGIYIACETTVDGQICCISPE
jgi:hypothetical protein